MKRNTLLLATCLITAALAGPVLAQGAAGGAAGNPPTGVATPGTAAPQATTAPTNTGTTAVAPTGSASTGPAMAGTATMAPRMAVTPMDPMKLDMKMMGTGVHSSRVVGMPVMNKSNEKVGVIDDLVMIPGDPTPYAVISVGTYVGGGTRHMVVPYSMLTSADKHMTMPNATKETVRAMPEYQFTGRG